MKCPVWLEQIIEASTGLRRIGYIGDHLETSTS